ncbi:uncharacterized protein BDFB_004386 [Asbolus verrucosus]|uniref:C-type lectin domain-containing protein n=1 Tax=Asbolus verrucosus TaxID=1661398 RepID=A0A482VDW2_ASBVE|nr:uncharacterized protein BDFB_004386 [Asbolus verrucosus]
MHASLLLLFLLPHALPLKHCFSEKPSLKFHKIRSCYKSNMPIISSKTLDTIGDCVKYARQKSGLAFNFSPPDLKNATLNRRYRNCQVMGCPETTNSSTLVFDPSFDYYSAYGDFNCKWFNLRIRGLQPKQLPATQNATCVKSVGLFDVVQEKRNYTEAINFCQNLGADLADVMSEVRTNALSTLLKSQRGWYKAAYVGLEDTDVEGTFENPMGNFLQCTKYRAWSVGHPRPNRKHEDCVILDADRVWKAINCKIKQRFICEFYAAPPESPLIEFTNKSCTRIKDPAMKRQCLANKELFEIYNNSSRIDQCALLNDFE